MEVQKFVPSAGPVEKDFFLEFAKFKRIQESNILGWNNDFDKVVFVMAKLLDPV